MERRIANVEELNRLRDAARAGTELREAPHDLRVTVHLGTCGIAAGARDVMGALISELAQAGAGGRVTVRQSGCAGLCGEEPMITISDARGEHRSGRLDRARVKEIVTEHLLGGEPIPRLLIHA